MSALRSTAATNPMAELKTKPTTASVADFLATVSDD